LRSHWFLLQRQTCSGAKAAFRERQPSAEKLQLSAAAP
jgi:hypothetical protein